MTKSPYPEALESAKRRAETVLERAHAELCSSDDEDRMTIPMAESLERIEKETRALEDLVQRRLLDWTQGSPAHVIAHEIDAATETLEDELRTFWELRQSAAVE